MRRRAIVVSFVVIASMFVGAPAAFAGAGGGGLGKGPDGNGPPGQQKQQSAGGPSETGKANAEANADRGMNREGEPGEWGENGHQPAPHSFPQGKSPSDPDADGNGGMDKPGGAGGFDADKDGNNGCGNDTDREDDNNGWCGLKPKPQTAPPAPPPPVTPPGNGGPPPDVGPPPSSGPPPGGGPVVLPRPAIVAPPTSTVEPRTLPRTGLDVGQVLIAGWGLVLAGTSMRARTRRGNR